MERSIKMKAKKSIRYSFPGEEHSPFLSKDVEGVFAYLTATFEAEKEKVRMIFCSFEKYEQIVNNLGREAQFVEVVGDNKRIKYGGVALENFFGSLVIVPDRNISEGVFYFEEE